MKLLLSSVFKPYGVDDEFGRKENIMELFHNQVTREQGIFSFRYHHKSFNLYLLAENVSIPSTVLDFPSIKRFIREIKKGYDFVGISFIAPNYIKAKKMCELIRQYSPRTKIILGGHGTQIPELEKIIDCDHIVKGEGISGLKKILGEPEDAPVKHVVLTSADNKRIMGIPVSETAGVLLPGVGCPNGCRFCCTTHMFNFKYTPFFKDALEMFNVMRKIENELGCSDFFVMDENFLKSKDRAIELLNLMKIHKKNYYFGVFSSAETINEIGVKFLFEIGIRFIWIGVESKEYCYTKNKNIDMKKLFTELRSHGISILASTILFQEHHDKKTIWEDVDYTLDLRPDFVQFMQLGPLPQTQLYLDYKEKGLLREDIPYEEWHGQHQLWFKHPNFTSEESEIFLRDAFLKDYRELGPSILRMAETYIQGYFYTQKYQNDPWLKMRNDQLKESCIRYYPLLSVLKTFMPNAKTRNITEQVIRSYEKAFGPKTIKQNILTLGAYLCAIKEYLKINITGDIRQPKTFFTKFNKPEFKLFPAVLKGKLLPDLSLNLLEIKQNYALSGNNIYLELHGILDSINVNNLQHRLAGLFNKEKKANIVLDIININRIDDNSLYKLLEHLKDFQFRTKLCYCAKIENISQMVEEIKLNFDTKLECLKENLIPESNTAR
ncbi:MAG: cobalamin-dependent protein [bacterium]|nr:cobalamin-dependent protein [bacterium]